MTLDQAVADRVDAAARQVLAEYRPPGFSVGVVSGGALAFARGYGFADIETARPQAPDLRQRIGSITKTMVGLCVMALVDEGKLSLSDRLVDKVPEVTLHGDGEQVTLRHMLTHTAGIGEVAMPADLEDTLSTLFSDVEGSGVLDMFPNGLTIEATPGGKWCYANLAYALLGEIVARAEGKPIAEVLQARVFGPLGMSNTDIADQPHPDLATGYHRNDPEEVKAARRKRGLTVEDEPTVDGLNVRGKFLYLNGAAAAGAVQSTIPDMARYAIALLNRGGGIVKPETFDAMVAPQWVAHPRLESWGLSFQRFERFGRRMFGHGGGVPGGWNTMLMILPDDGQALMVHCNAAFEGAERIFSRILAALVGAAPRVFAGDIAPAVLEAAPGVYEAASPGPLTNFRVSGALGRIQLLARGGALYAYSRRGAWKDGKRIWPADPADPELLMVEDDPLEPSRIAARLGPAGRLAALHIHRLVAMTPTETTPAWVE